MGQLLRSKGFLWIVTSHDIIGEWQQAGNIIHLEAEQPWMCMSREMWEDAESAELIYKDKGRSGSTPTNAKSLSSSDRV